MSDSGDTPAMHFEVCMAYVEGWMFATNPPTEVKEAWDYIKRNATLNEGDA